MIACENCRTPISPEQINRNEYTPCGYCGTLLQTHVFPAANKQVSDEQKQPEIIVTDEAGCFYHPTKKAVAPCSSCGRFLCALCDIEMDGKHICFSCMESGAENNELDQLENHRFLADGLALRISFLPVLLPMFIWFTCITAPISIFYVVRYWNRTNSITPRSRWRFVAAFMFSGLQLLGWAALILMAVFK